MSDYAHSSFALESAKNILHAKMKAQQILAKSHDQDIDFDHKSTKNVHTIENLLLLEARFAHKYWKSLRTILSGKVVFYGRKPQTNDPVNRLLDIGYHHLTGKVSALFQKHHMNTSIGLFHQPRTSTSEPLVYDFMELFRADIVDAELIKYFHLKKKPVQELNTDEIPLFLSRINIKLNKSFYLKNFSNCRSYHYYMELQILRFAKCVRTKQVFFPISIPRRHENRC